MKKYALVVGVKEHQDPEITNLPFAARDAEHVAWVPEPPSGVPPGRADRSSLTAVPSFRAQYTRGRGLRTQSPFHPVSREDIMMKQLGDVCRMTVGPPRGHLFYFAAFSSLLLFCAGHDCDDAHRRHGSARPHE